MFDSQILIPPQTDRYFSSFPALYTPATLLCSGYGRQGVRDGDEERRECVDIFFRFAYVS
jgi:hypothetical protein